MRTWERCTHVARCGHCGAVLTVGMAMQRIQFTGQKRRLVRCADCADGEVPPDLPLLVEPGRSTKPMQPIATTAAKVTHDWMPYKDA